MEKDKISIIVPVYNTEEYLEKCINSLINQTYQNIEILLIDDGSTDHSLEICSSFEAKDKRIRVFSKENAGQGVARNFGLENATGDFIGFTDSDDWVVPDMFGFLHEQLIYHEVEMAICGMYMDNSIIQRIDHTNQFKVMDNYGLMKEFLRFDSPLRVNIYNKLYKKELWSDIRFPKVRAREDAFVTFELLGRTKTAVVLTDEKYIQHIRKGSTEKASFNHNKLADIEASQKQKKYIEANYDDTLYGYACFQMAGTYLGLLEDIIKCHQVFRNTILINKLYQEYILEIKNLTNYITLEPERYRYLKSYTKSRFYCIVKIYKEQIILNLKVRMLKSGIIRNIVLFLKHR